MITSAACGLFDAPARDMGVIAAATPRGDGAIPGDDPLAVGVIRSYMYMG